MKLTFVNVGYGECILLQEEKTSSGEGSFTMLLDGGSAESAEYADRSTGRITAQEYLRSLCIRKLDVLACTHIHEDHLCGLLPVFRNIKADEYWQLLPDELSGRLPDLDVSLAGNDSERKFLHALNDYQSLCRQARQAGVRIVSPYEPGIFRPCEDLTIRVSGPSPETREALDEDIRMLYGRYRSCGREEFLRSLDRVDAAMNNRSLILQITYGKTKILLPGDTNAAGWAEIPDKDLRADLYKVGHHGQKDGCSRQLMEKIRPHFVICCASGDRRYQSAAPELISMIGSCGAEMYYSDCPKVPGITDTEETMLTPHHAVSFDIEKDGKVTPHYEV